MIDYLTVYIISFLIVLFYANYVFIVAPDYYTQENKTMFFWFMLMPGFNTVGAGIIVVVYLYDFAKWLVFWPSSGRK